MKVKDVMTTEAKTCMPETSLVDAASLMWEHDCGALPVLDVDGKVVGMVTDRDICFGATTKNRQQPETPSYMTRAQAVTPHATAYVADPWGRSRRPKHEPQPSHGS
jgi:CBS domain-containing protein